MIHRENAVCNSLLWLRLPRWVYVAVINSAVPLLVCSMDVSRFTVL
jgi:hypothetical protein